MKEETLSRIREEILKENKEIIAYNVKVKRLRMLEKDRAVKEYLQLLSELGINPKLIRRANKSIFEEAVYDQIDKIHSDETNGIFVCLGTYRDSKDTDIMHGPAAMRVSYDAEDAEYRVYLDIEQSRKEEIEVPIDKCKQFEKDHIVIIPTMFEENVVYRQVQGAFFEMAIKQDQEKAKQKILRRYKNQIKKN